MGVRCRATIPMLPPIRCARKLRREATPPERHFWRALRTAYPAHHWRRQVAIGPYFADFAEHALRLVIEVDGGHHAERAIEDARRTALLNERGYHVLRFWATEVMDNMDGVLATLASHLPASHPHLTLPARGRA